MTPAQASVGLSERISLGGRPIAGFHLVGIGQETPITVQLDFSSDKPVTPQQFFKLVGSVQAELVPDASTISFMPLTDQTFRGTFKIPSSFAHELQIGDSEEIQGVLFTLTGISTPESTPAPPLVEKKKGLSTGAIVGIGVGVVTVGGGIIYAATRKKKKHRKRATA